MSLTNVIGMRKPLYWTMRFVKNMLGMLFRISEVLYRTSRMVHLTNIKKRPMDVSLPSRTLVAQENPNLFMS